MGWSLIYVCAGGITIVWLMSSLAKRALAPITGLQSNFSPEEYMEVTELDLAIDRFQVDLSLSGDKGAWYVCHRFSDRPGIETLKLLKDEAIMQYEEIFEEDPDAISMTLDYLETEMPAAKTNTYVQPS